MHSHSLTEWRRRRGPVALLCFSLSSVHPCTAIIAPAESKSERASKREELPREVKVKLVQSKVYYSHTLLYRSITLVQNGWSVCRSRRERKRPSCLQPREREERKPGMPCHKFTPLMLAVHFCTYLLTILHTMQCKAHNRLPCTVGVHAAFGL